MLKLMLHETVLFLILYRPKPTALSAVCKLHSHTEKNKHAAHSHVRDLFSHLTETAT